MAGDPFAESELKILTDAFERSIQENTEDPDLWDGDEAASEIYREFLEWLPDIVRHRVASRLRESYPGAPVWAKHVSDSVDPFEIKPDSSGLPSWYRKRDGRLVPWRVAPDPTPEEQREDQHE